MQRNLFTVIFVMIAFIPSFSQEAITHSKVVQVDSVNKAALFSMVHEWFASTYNSANDVIQMADKEAGTIIGKGLLRYSYGKATYTCYEGTISYTIKVSVKDNRYKVELTNFIHTPDPGHGPCGLGVITDQAPPTPKGFLKGYHQNVWADIKAKTDEFSKSAIASLEAKTKKSAKDDF